MPGSAAKKKKTAAAAKKRKASTTKDENDDTPNKRQRKSSTEASFEPEDFTMQDASGVKIVIGRGKQLQDFPSVVASMEKHTTEDVLFAHKFLFGNKGSSLKKKDLLKNLGEFSGYLRQVPKGYDEDKLEKEDEREEVSLRQRLIGRFSTQHLCRILLRVSVFPPLLTDSNVVFSRNDTRKRRSR